MLPVVLTLQLLAAEPEEEEPSRQRPPLVLGIAGAVLIQVGLTFVWWGYESRVQPMRMPFSMALDQPPVMAPIGGGVALLGGLVVAAALLWALQRVNSSDP